MVQNPKGGIFALPLIEMLRRMQEIEFPRMPATGLGFMATYSDMGTQTLTFMSERIRQGVKTQQDLMNAKGLAEVRHIQMQFFQRALDDYTNQMVKLAELGKTVAPNMTANSDRS